MKKRRDSEREVPESAAVAAEAAAVATGEVAVGLEAAGGMSARRPSGSAALDSDSDSTSTELCDEPDRMSDLDSEELDPPVPSGEGVSPMLESQTTAGKSSDLLDVSKEETSIAEITDQIRRLSADDADFKTSLDDGHTISDEKPAILEASQLDGEKRSTFSSTLDIDQPIEEKKTILESYDTGQFIEDKKATSYGSLDVVSPTSFERSSSNLGSLHVDLSTRENKSKDFDSFDIGLFASEKKTKDYSSLDIGFSTPDNKPTNLSSFDVVTKSANDSRLLDDNSAVTTKTFDDKALAKDESGSVASRLDDSYDFLTLRSRVGIDEAKSASASVPSDSSDDKRDVGVTLPTRSSYVIGHLPIAPINYESRKNRVSPDTFVSRDEVNSMRDRLERDTFTSTLGTSILSPESKFSNYKIQLEPKRSPKTPESAKSFSSGETMGPDSITSSLAVSPKTPLRSESRDFVLADKSMASSVSSDSKTLTMRSVESAEVTKKVVETVEVTTPGDKSVTPSTDSLAQVKSTDPPCSSTESFCSPSKPKSSERSFSSDLQSPVSTTSIKYTTNYSYKSDGMDLQKPSSEIGPITSPFYPILNPNQKTPSPYGEDKNKISKDDGSDEFRGISYDRDSKHYLETKTSIQAFDVSQIKSPEEASKSSIQAFDISQMEHPEENISIKISSENLSFMESTKRLYSFELDDSSVSDKKSTEKETGRISAFQAYRKNKFEDDLHETDTLSPLPCNQFENRSDIFERSRGRSLDGKLETLEISGKSYERSSSSLEKRFPDMLLSPSMEDFANSVKKRSSDVLEDLRHLEAKTTSDGEIDPSMLTRKTSFIWEDLKILEARRQDTFSDSASNFSRQRIDVPGISISTEGRKTYIVEPKINIDENSDSILKTVTYKSSNSNSHDDDGEDETKLGVWTKVKPRKRNDNGRRSSDRALKIIQENSAILQKILTCQARKRLPDLEEISKEITISPINEEISKIFSPILEKMGLNEHEINEELARINFKDLDRNTTTTTASEFDAKINDELSKLSLIGDNEEVAYLPDVDDLSTDYLVARDEFIDRQINEELSKLLANYGEDSPMAHQKGSSSLNASDDISNCSTNVYSYQSSNDSLDIKSDLGPKDPLHPLIYPDNPLPYVPRNDYAMPLSKSNISAKSDVDIYRELEKLDQISYAKALPSVSTEIVHPDIIPSTIPYISDIIRSPKHDYPSSAIEKQPTYDISPLKSPYDSPYSSSSLQTSSYDYKSRISPRKTPSNPYSVRSYDTKSTLDTGFENSTFELTRKAAVPSTLNYEYGSKKHILSKEHLEFRVKYDQGDELSANKKSITRDVDLKLSPFQSDIPELDKGASYYTNKQVITPTNKYSSNNDDITALASTVERSSYESTYQRRKYENISPADKYSSYSDNYDVLRQPYKTSVLDPEAEVSSYLTGAPVTTSTRRETHVLSPHYPYTDYTKTISSSYATVSPSFDDTRTTAATRSKTTYADISPTDTLSYRKSTMTLGSIGSTTQIGNNDKYNFDGSPSPKSGFNPFPVRNAQRKPKELTVKLGLYSPTNSGLSKRS